MKKFMTYVCEHCGRGSGSEDEIEECEAKGIFQPMLFQSAIGVLIQYRGMTFCVVNFKVWEKHYGIPLAWAWRDTANGDTTNELCATRAQSITNASKFPSEDDAVTDFESPHFQRAVEHMAAKGEPVRYWDGKGIRTWQFAQSKV